MGKSTINGHFQLQTVSSPEGRNHGEDHVEHHEPSRMQEFQEHVEISSA